MWKYIPPADENQTVEVPAIVTESGEVTTEMQTWKWCKHCVCCSTQKVGFYNPSHTPLQIMTLTSLVVLKPRWSRSWPKIMRKVNLPMRIFLQQLKKLKKLKILTRTHVSLGKEPDGVLSKTQTMVDSALHSNALLSMRDWKAISIALILRGVGCLHIYLAAKATRRSADMACFWISWILPSQFLLLARVFL